MHAGRKVLVGLVFALVLFGAVNLLAGVMLRSARLDMTEDKLFTLSDGALNIAAQVEEPIRLQLFFSEEAGNERPDYKSYAQRVRESLEEFARASDGMITLEFLDPEPYSEAEDLADGAGLTGVPLGGAGTRLYLGLVGTNSVDDQETIPWFDPSKEQFLEYDLARLIHTLSQTDKITVGVLSSLPLQGRFDPSNPGRPTPEWAIVQQLKGLYEYRNISPAAKEIPEEVDVLLVVHPKGFSEETLYAVDQFLMGGGRLIACLDPHCELDMSGADPNNPMAAMTADKSSDFGPFLETWGIGLDKEAVVADREYAAAVTSRQRSGPAQIDFVVYLELAEGAFAEESPITGNLNTVIMAMAGGLTHDNPDLSFEPLVTTSADSSTLEKSSLTMFPDPGQLLADFKPDSKVYTLAARVSGTLPSAFPDGKPGGDDPAEAAAGTNGDPLDGQNDGQEAEGEEDEPAEHLSESRDDAQVILVADADFLADQFWIREERMGPISFGWRLFADNGNLILNAVEMLGGSQDLVKIRSRGRFSRPFDRVRDLEQKAAEQYHAEEQALQERIQESEMRINELQREKQGDSLLILSPEQQEEVTRLQETMLSARKELREVRHNLRKDIEGLGKRLLYINAGAVPLAVAVSAVFFGLRRRNRRRQSSSSN